MDQGVIIAIVFLVVLVAGVGVVAVNSWRHRPWMDNTTADNPMRVHADRPADAGAEGMHVVGPGDVTAGPTPGEPGDSGAAGDANPRH